MKSLLFLALMCMTSARVKGSVLIETELFKLDQTGNVLTLSDVKGGEQALSATIDLPGNIESQQVRTVSDPLWGRGREVVLKHGNRATSMRLYEGNPFAHLETRVSNPNREYLDLRKLEIAEFTFDLRVDPGRLATLREAKPYLQLISTSRHI